MFSSVNKSDSCRNRKPLWKKGVALMSIALLLFTASPSPALAGAKSVSVHRQRHRRTAYERVLNQFSISSRSWNSLLSQVIWILSTARLFPEPLVPVGSAPVTGENKALAASLKEFKSALTLMIFPLYKFYCQKPKSRWVPSLQLNLGLLMYDRSLLTPARDAWLAAWNATKNEIWRCPKSRGG